MNSKGSTNINFHRNWNIDNFMVLSCITSMKFNQKYCIKILDFIHEMKYISLTPCFLFSYLVRIQSHAQKKNIYLIAKNKSKFLHEEYKSNEATFYKQNKLHEMILKSDEWMAQSYFACNINNVWVVFSFIFSFNILYFSYSSNSAQWVDRHSLLVSAYVCRFYWRHRRRRLIHTYLNINKVKCICFNYIDFVLFTKIRKRKKKKRKQVLVIGL